MVYIVFQGFTWCSTSLPYRSIPFPLCAKILAISIRRSDEIKGFKFKTKELKLCQYADDTQMLLDGSEKSVRNTIK
jgi:hypothetical protein